MKSIPSLCLAVVALTASMGLVSQANARDLAIAGSIETAEVAEIVFPVLTAKVHGTGQASHFGRYAFFMDVTVNLINSTSTGTYSIRVANGDQLTGTVAGIGSPTDQPNLHLLVEILTIVSGTGQFKDASGTLTITRIANSDTFRGSGNLEGTLKVPDNRGHQQ